MSDGILSLFNVAISVATILLTVRLFVQLADADSQNPYVRATYKATRGFDWAGRLLPRPGGGRLALGFIVLLFLLRLLGWGMNSTYGDMGLPSSAMLLQVTVFSLLLDCISVMRWIVIAAIISSWIIMLFQSSSPLMYLLNQLPEPLFASLRRYLPNTGMLDIAPLVAFLILIVARVLMENAAISTGAGRYLGLG